MKLLPQSAQKDVIGGAQNHKPKKECPCKNKKKNAEKEASWQSFFWDIFS